MTWKVIFKWDMFRNYKMQTEEDTDEGEGTNKRSGGGKKNLFSLHVWFVCSLVQVIGVRS